MQKINFDAIIGIFRSHLYFEGSADVRRSSGKFGAKINNRRYNRRTCEGGDSAGGGGGGRGRSPTGQRDRSQSR